MGVLYFLLFLLKFTIAFNITFHPPTVKITEEQEAEVNFTWTVLPEADKTNLELSVDNTKIAELTDSDLNYDENRGNLTVKGIFLGRTKIQACLYSDTNKSCEELPVTVLKKERAITKAFIISVAIAVTLSYVNMGCALDLVVVKNVLMRPVGPLVGFFCQYLIMPLVAYGVGKLFFSDSIMQLGLFTFGCSPSGGASNMWTVLLQGNLNLSLTVTFINNVLALGMMPFWLFTLGKSLFVTTSVPYRNIFTSLVSMIVPLGLGVLMQKYFPRAAKFLKKMLSVVSVVIIIFIIVFAIYANLYMFKLFTWKIILAAAINVWLGFAMAAIAATIMRLPVADRVAVMVETGIQNTGISYILLNSSLPQPDSDIASVIPIAGSIVTPVPLVLIYLYLKLRNSKFCNNFCNFNKITEDEKIQIIEN